MEGIDRVHRGGGGDGNGNQKKDMIAWQVGAGCVSVCERLCV